ncbi:DNA polymerase/3'-5' exonuclease PolX [Candidatus Berkelbacteria bacterium]|nr:DNA polymerase/3'-5' exonuclease PolX [Candidatus Berkelbacteria bacterium]
MINRELSKILREIADLKEVVGENRFKVVAYQRAAQNVSNLSEDLAIIYKENGIKGLEQIEGIGKAIAGHIEDYIKTGKVKEWERLRQKVAPAVLKLMNVPGIGPKTALKLADTLEVVSIEGLKKELAKASPKTRAKLAKIGLKEKSIKKILTGISIREKLETRMLYVNAEPIVAKIVEYMGRLPGMVRFDPVGSFRRKRETVGDLDFIAAARDPKQAIEYFVNGPFVEKVLAKGLTKATVIENTTGQQLDLEILPAKKYGSLLQHFTGSKEHNVALRTWGVAHGFSISEHGIKKSKIKNQKSKIITCDNEEKVYKTLGMDFIPPELRENRGEIQAALAHKLPKLITLKDLKGDLQMHSNWSDGQQSIEQMARAAQKLGHRYIAITDHSLGLGIARGLNEKRLTERRREIERVRKKCSITIFEGIEVDIRADGSLDLPEPVLAKLDFVIASIHSGFQQGPEQITKRLLAAIASPAVHGIAHPTGRMIGTRPPYSADWPVVYKAAAKHGKILEIDSHPVRLDLNDAMVKEAKGYGVKFSIDTDAHHSEHLTYLRYGIGIAQRGWLTKADVVNTMDGNELIRFLHRHRAR